jgi:hypothetical protein
MILDNEPDEAEGASAYIERDPTSYNTFPTSEFALAPTESIDASDLWYDIEEDRYIEEPGLGLSEPHGVLSAPAQAQPQTLPRPPRPRRDQTDQQGIGSTTQSTSVESTLQSLSKPSDCSDDKWTDKKTSGMH